MSKVMYMDEEYGGANISECLLLDIPSFSSLPLVITDPKIPLDACVVNATLSNPSAQTGDWTGQATAKGEYTITGSISGSTALQLVLAKCHRNMAESKIEMKGASCFLIQGNLKNQVTVNAGQNGLLINELTLSDAMNVNIGNVPSGKKLVGVVPLWTNGTYEFVFTNTYVDANEKIFVGGYNRSNGARTYTAVRLLTFWI